MDLNLKTPPFVKDIVGDLIEKRLWPLALALLVALVAVPVLLGGGGEDSSAERSCLSGTRAGWSATSGCRWHA